MDMSHKTIDLDRENNCSCDHSDQMGRDLNGVHKTPRPVDNLKQTGRLPIPLLSFILQSAFVYILDRCAETVKHGLQQDKTN